MSRFKVCFLELSYYFVTMVIHEAGSLEKWITQDQVRSTKRQYVAL